MTDPTTDRAIGGRNYALTSPPMKIAKTYWRFVVYQSRYHGLSTDYEWLNTSYDPDGVWHPEEDTDLKISTEDKAALMTYARCFYYGEG